MDVHNKRCAGRRTESSIGRADAAGVNKLGRWRLLSCHSDGLVYEILSEKKIVCYDL